MQTARASRRPVSTRHAFALALDLALLRDPLQSVLLPFLLRAPWFLAIVLLTPARESIRSGPVVLVSTLALLGGSISWWAVDAMLRVRARSVYGTLHHEAPAPPLECYERALARLPWLYLTEFIRGAAVALGFSMFVVPGVWLSYKLAFSTEAVVLDEHNTTGAFEHSFRLSRGRLERWLEMVVASVFLVLGLLFLGTLLSLAIRWLSFETWKRVTLMLLVALAPVFQYAWTFFYLRLVELERFPADSQPATGLQAGPPPGRTGLPPESPTLESRAVPESESAPSRA